MGSQIGVIAIDAAGNTAGTSHDSGVTAFVGLDNRDAVPALLALSKALTAREFPANRAERSSCETKPRRQ